METTTQGLGMEEAPAIPGSAAKLIREVRAKTRRQFSAQDKIRIILEGFRKEIPVSDLCRREGLSSVLYYSWLKDFMEAGKAHLKGDTRRDATQSEVKELREENARKEGHLTENDPMPKIYSNNGSGFTSKLLAEYLSPHGIGHIFGTPYPPQRRGKIERFNRRIKGKLCRFVYCSPDQLKEAVDETIATYNSNPHDSLD